VEILGSPLALRSGRSVRSDLSDGRFGRTASRRPGFAGRFGRFFRQSQHVVDDPKALMLSAFRRLDGKRILESKRLALQL
jgi:hypothetical protein